jgi:hypothetical protein
VLPILNSGDEKDPLPEDLQRGWHLGEYENLIFTADMPNEKSENK